MREKVFNFVFLVFLGFIILLYQNCADSSSVLKRSMPGSSSQGSSSGGSQTPPPSGGGSPPVIPPPVVPPATGTLNPRYWDASDIGKLMVPDSTTGNTYYVDKVNGSDSLVCLNKTTYKTIKKAITCLQPGDTIRIKSGMYFEGADLSARGVSGTAAMPITIGPYGDGEVILNAGQSVTWSIDTGRVWKAIIPTGWTPGGVVVNEVPLKEVNHGQTNYPAASPVQGRSTVTDNSGKWFFNTSTRTLYADMGAAVGANDPNNYLNFIIKANQADQHVYYYFQDHIKIYGLTIIGNGGPGVFGYGNNITVERCNIKFNYKQGISFMGNNGNDGNTNNQALYNNIYHNCQNNWPRANNNFSGGSWNQGISGNSTYKMVARGNIVAFNGGEGIGSYGTDNGIGKFGESLFEDNIVHDNWSVNVYFDNQNGAVIRNNIIYNKDVDLADMIGNTNAGAAADVGRKLAAVGIMIADEEWSSANVNGFANVNNVKVYNNLIANSRVGIRDYAEGNNSVANHGLKNTDIVNNTIITPLIPSADYNAGIEIQDNGNKNINSNIKNNLIIARTAQANVIWLRAPSVSGITINNNLYFNTASANGVTFRYNEADSIPNATFQQWKAQYPGVDVNSLYVNPQITDVTQFSGNGNFSAAAAYILATSPAKNAGVVLPAFPFDFNYNARPQGASTDIGFIELP